MAYPSRIIYKYLNEYHLQIKNKGILTFYSEQKNREIYK